MGTGHSHHPELLGRQAYTSPKTTQATTRHCKVSSSHTGFDFNITRSICYCNTVHQDTYDTTHKPNNNNRDTARYSRAEASIYSFAALVRGQASRSLATIHVAPSPVLAMARGLIGES